MFDSYLSYCVFSAASPQVMQMNETENGEHHAMFRPHSPSFGFRVAPLQKQNKTGYGSYLSRTFLLQPLRSHATCTNEEYCSLRCLKKIKIAGNNVQQLAVLTSFTRKDAK